MPTYVAILRRLSETNLKADARIRWGKEDTE